MDEQFEKGIHALAQQIRSMHDQAVAVYTPLVDDICIRVAPMKEVEWLLDYMFGFVGDERMLLLFKRVCRHYWQVYPEMIAWHIMEYRKEYDPQLLVDCDMERITMDRIYQTLKENRHPVNKWYYGHFHQKWNWKFEDTDFKMLDIMEFATVRITDTL